MPFGWAVALGAANYVNKKVMENRAAEASETAAMAEDIRIRKQADDAATLATAQLMSAGRDAEFVVIPDYSTGGTKTISLNQYATKSATPAFSPDPNLAWYNALSTKENKIDGSRHRFVQVNPNLTPDVLKAGQFTDGTAVQAGRDYVLFENVAPTAGERETTGISNWRNTLLDSEEALQLALAQAKDGDDTALSKIMTIGSDLVSLWQKGQEPQVMTEGKTYYQAQPFDENGPLAFMKNNPAFQDEAFFIPFMQNVASQNKYEFINSLNELGYNLPINNPTSFQLGADGKTYLTTVGLTGEWDDLKVPVNQDGRRGFGSRNQEMQWSPEFVNTVGSWADRSGRSQYEWLRTLNYIAENSESINDARGAYNVIEDFEKRLAKLGQPVDVTGGTPVYRQSWGMAVKSEFKQLLGELNIKGADAAMVVGALMPVDMYKGLRTRMLSGGKGLLGSVLPGEDINQLRSELGDTRSNIKNAKLIRETTIAGTGLTADLKSLQAGAADQARQLSILLGEDPEGVGGSLLGTLKGFFDPDELDPEALAKLGRDDLLLKLRKFATIQLMYSFAKGMGGSGSDRLSDQDAKNALEALQVSGLLNTESGMNLVMTALITGMEKREQVLSGLVSGDERQIIGGLFINNINDNNLRFSITGAIMEAWTQQYAKNPSSVSRNPASPTTPPASRN